MRVLARRIDWICLGHPPQDARGMDGNSVLARQFAHGTCMLASPSAQVITAPGTLPLGPCIRVWSHVLSSPVRVIVVVRLPEPVKWHFPSQLSLCIAAQFRESKSVWHSQLLLAQDPLPRSLCQPPETQHQPCSGTRISRLPTWLAALTKPLSSICSTSRAALL